MIPLLTAAKRPGEASYSTLKLLSATTVAVRGGIGPKPQLSRFSESISIQIHSFEKTKKIKGGKIPPL
jgi:hypothetical protein